MPHNENPVVVNVHNHGCLSLRGCLLAVGVLALLSLIGWVGCSMVAVAVVDAANVLPRQPIVVDVPKPQLPVEAKPKANPKPIDEKKNPHDDVFDFAESFVGMWDLWLNFEPDNPEHVRVMRRRLKTIADENPGTKEADEINARLGEIDEVIERLVADRKAKEPEPFVLPKKVDDIPKNPVADLFEQEERQRLDERAAQQKLNLALAVKDRNPVAYRKRIEDVAIGYPHTKAGKEAKRLLDSLD